VQQDERKICHDSDSVGSGGYRRPVTSTELRTERLLLRPLVAADRETVIAIQTDPRTNRYHPDPPTAEAAKAKFETWLADWADDGFGYVAVIETTTGEFIGVGGVQLRQFEGEKILNLYYRFRPEFWGRGYATEMASAVVAWAERELPYPIQITVSVENTPSLRIAEKLGFTAYAESVYAGIPSRHFRR